ncbi:MAG: Restriction endonuclease, type II, AlwI [Parcubacteria group bacterium Greene0416_79]|nr:MAG: Restriction endonuclease, type II, AlwI [Parcubacteria group bacterium Greene0416_79]
MNRRASEYKPLLFTTTMRNPERLKWFLGVLKNYDRQVLANELAEEISGELIRIGLYKPTRLTKTIKNKINEKSPLTDKEVAKVLKDNPQNHKEAGFNKGWPSRFDTWFKLAKELGFVFYEIGKPIRFSEIGLKLVDSNHPEFEQQAFLNAFVKYQSNNPFRRVLNENVPLILLLQVIKRLNEDKNFNNTGISRLEIPLVIYWKDSDAEKLYVRIKQLRKRFGYSPSMEVISEICRDEIMQGTDIVRDNESIMTDYPDEFVRKMRLTGLISLRGGGRFIDINKNEQAKVDYVLKTYAKYEKYDSEEKYFEYISKVDQNLVSVLTKSVTVEEQDKYLKKWIKVYPWETIKTEMLNLGGRQLTNDEILKYLSNPIRLEFLTALAIKSKFPKVKVIPNYPVDDEGIPTATAAGTGNTGDIECYENVNGILIEVTMSEGRTQTMMEVWPIVRHLEEFGKKAKSSMCYFVAPSIFSDSLRQIEFVKKTDGLFIAPKTIEEFIKHLDESEVLYSL